jgi:hypothetical protein
MRLRKASSWVFSASLLVLAANAILLVLISRAYDDVVAVQDHRRATTLSAEQFRRETEHLTQFVRSYTATGDDRYLLYYYDILAVREGKKPAPQNFKSGSYWDDVVARRIVHTTPELGARQSFTDTMKALGFSTNEGQAFSKRLLQLLKDCTIPTNRSLSPMDPCALILPSSWSTVTHTTA